VSERRIAFARPSMAITLNGIAQGLIADRVAALLRREGLRDILVDAGEIVAGGRASDGRAWSAAIATPDGQAIRRLSLADRALAVSSTLALAFDPAGTAGHILDPRTGAPAPPGTVAVSAVSAALADGLSTAFCLLGPAARAAALAIFPGARIEATA
jgi:thiamine biosynthesis lipoprotein